MLDILMRAGSFIAIIVMGYLLKRIGFFKQEDFSVLSKIVIRITLPCAIVTSFAGKVIDPALLSLAFIAVSCGIAYITIALFINRNHKGTNVVSGKIQHFKGLLLPAVIPVNK